MRARGGAVSAGGPAARGNGVGGAADHGNGASVGGAVARGDAASAGGVVAHDDVTARRGGVRVVVLGAGAAVAGTALLAASGWLVTRAAERPPVLALLAAIVVVRALGLVRAFARYGERIAAHDAAFAALAGLRVRWYRGLIASGTQSLPAAELLSRFVIDVDELQHRDLRVRWPVVVGAVAAGATTAIATAILPLAGLVLGTGLLLAGTLVPGLAYLSARHGLRRQGSARAALVDELVEAMDAATPLALAGRAPERLERLDRASADLSAIGRRDAAAAALAQGLGVLVAGASLIGVLLVAGGADLDPVWLGALALLALGAFEALAPLPEAAVRAVGVKAAERRLEEAVGGGCVTPAAAQEALVTHPPTLTARGLRHRPDGGPLVLDGVDFDLAEGERVALIGASGAGKTVLANLLAGLATPDEGEISIPDHVRLAGQEAHLFATSIANNVRIGAPHATDQDIDLALRATGLGDWLDALPDGIHTLVGEEGFAVSGGQRQRIALARCLVSPARLLLLDEPTAMLDPPAARAFLTDLERAAGDRGVLVITHQRGGLEEAFDRVLELRDGSLTER